MHSLALLIAAAAAAGVNAMIGAEINAVVIPGSKYLCADNCQEQGIFFGQEGTCFESEAVVRVKPDGQDFYSIPNESFTCPRRYRADGRPAWRERKPTEAPPPCEPRPFKCPKDIGCYSNKQGGGSSGPDITLEIEEVKRRLGGGASAPGQQPTPAPEKPAQKQPPASDKLDAQCKKTASGKVQECTSKGVAFEVCDKAARGWIERCKAGQ